MVLAAWFPYGGACVLDVPYMDGQVVNKDIRNIPSKCRSTRGDDLLITGSGMESPPRFREFY